MVNITKMKKKLSNGYVYNDDESIWMKNMRNYFIKVNFMTIWLTY